MRADDFSDWLSVQGLSSNAIQSRLSLARRIEKAFQSTYPDGLDEAFDADDMVFILDRLVSWKNSPEKHEDEIGNVFTEGGNAKKLLPNYLNALRKYRDFRIEAPIDASDANQIREYVLAEIVEPARASDEATVDFVVRDINKALGLTDAWLNICQAVRGRKFLELADLPPAQSFGAEKSSATRFRFDLTQDDYWALRSLVQRYGEPFKRTAKIASFVLADGRQLALDIENTRTQLWLEGEVADRDEPGFSASLYVANAPRHSNLPERLRHKGQFARPVSLVTVPNSEILADVLDEYSAAHDSFDRQKLELLKEVFLERFPDFEGQGGFAGKSEFHKEEDDYKRALVDAAQKLLIEMEGEPDELLGSSFIELLAGRASGLSSNLIDWWAQRIVDNAEMAKPGLVSAAVGALVRAQDAVEGVEGFLSATWEVLRGEAQNNPYAESRMFPTMLRALVDPNSILPIRSTPTDNAIRTLEGKRAFANARLTKAELVTVTSTARKIMRIMDEEWNWEPRDFWDIQSFIWVTCQKRLGEKEDSSISLEADIKSDDGPFWFVGAAFGGSVDQMDRFLSDGIWEIANPSDRHRAQVQSMRPGQRIAIKSTYTKKHGLPFDNKGRSVSVMAIKATGIITSEAGTGEQVSVKWDEPSQDREWYHYTYQPTVWEVYPEQEMARRLIAFAFDGDNQDYEWFLANLRNWKDIEPGLDEDAEEETVADPRTSDPQNLILYGPPGTGKTYQTMSEAVRLCLDLNHDDSLLESDNRTALKDEYKRLQDNKQIAFVTFHQNYSYEDFVEGLRPVTQKEGAGFKLIPQPGIFRLLVEQAEDSPEQHVLVIDEINRANISKVFGELITLIERDKRLGMSEAIRLRLPYSQKHFGVPANLHIVGTMNTADRSIALLDTALRRRFQFKEMAPDTSVQAFQEAEKSTGLPLVDVLKTMNRRIEYLVDRDHRIGHAFFIGCEDQSDVDSVMRDKVIPLLQEYFFDDWDRLAAVLGEKEKGGNFLSCDSIQDPMGEGGEPLKSWSVRSEFGKEAYSRLVSGKTDPALSPEAQPLD